MTYRTYSPITGNPELTKAIAEGCVYKETDRVDGVSNYVEIEPEIKEDEE